MGLPAWISLSWDYPKTLSWQRFPRLLLPLFFPVIKKFLKSQFEWMLNLCFSSQGAFPQDHWRLFTTVLCWPVTDRLTECLCPPVKDQWLPPERSSLQGEEECLDQTASWSPMQFMGLILFLLISGQHQGSSPSRQSRDMHDSGAISAEVIGSLKIT